MEVQITLVSRMNEDTVNILDRVIFEIWDDPVHGK